ncbi:hypothetical protein HQ524_00135 [Candidatus Uhrbacteria bacterium]|nr:hypothetical protein [Candidatus Uhrbacteria bacterium]
MPSNDELFLGRMVFVAFPDMLHLGVCSMEVKGIFGEVLNEDGDRLFDLAIDEGIVHDDAGEVFEFEFEVVMGGMFASFDRAKVQEFFLRQSRIATILMRAE